jgi:organic radical activating enzyme
MPYYLRDGKIHTEGISVIAASHCNLQCADCCALSCYQSPSFPNLDSVAADLERLGTAVHARELRILGGEPLLNPQLGELTRLAKQSNVGDLVTLFSNGRLLDRMDETTWRSIDQLSLSLYPNALPSAEALGDAINRARKDGIRLRLFRRHRFEKRVVNTPHPLDWKTRVIYRTCRAANYDHCHRVHEGRLYQCYIPLALPDYLQRLGPNDYTPEADALHLHEATDLLSSLMRYLLSPQPLDACRYCLGSMGRRHPHRQLTAGEVRDPAATPTSRSTHLSPTRVIMHLTGHLRHMAANRLRGGFG